MRKFIRLFFFARTRARYRESGIVSSPDPTLAEGGVWGRLYIERLGTRIIGTRPAAVYVHVEGTNCMNYSEAEVALGSFLDQAGMFQQSLLESKNPTRHQFI